MKRLIIASFLTLLIIAGCGYTAGSLVPGHIKTIYVESFKNETNEPDIDIEATNNIKDRFAWNGQLEIVNDKDQADSMLSGTITDYEKQPLAFGDNDEITEYRLVITVDMVFYDLINDKVIWQEEDFKVDSEYYSTLREQKFSSAQIDREKLIENVTDELAREVVNRTVEGW